jgi:hypothetical protein
MKVMKNIVYIFIIITLSCCSSANKKQQINIIYNEIDAINEVRIELPNGGSKIIYKIDEPIFESGRKCPQSFSQPIGLEYINKAPNYKLVNTSFAKLSGGIFDVFYIYQKKDSVMVYGEQISIVGLNDLGLVFKGNLQKMKGDKLIHKNESKQQTDEIIKEYRSDFDPKNTIKLIEKGNNVILNEYQNEYLLSSLKGKLFNGKLFINSDYNAAIIYYFDNSKLCYHYEGSPDENRFSKTKETLNGVELCPCCNGTGKISL